MAVPCRRVLPRCIPWVAAVLKHRSDLPGREPCRSLTGPPGWRTRQTTTDRYGRSRLGTFANTPSIRSAVKRAWCASTVRIPAESTPRRRQLMRRGLSPASSRSAVGGRPGHAGEGADGGARRVVPVHPELRGRADRWASTRASAGLGVLRHATRLVATSAAIRFWRNHRRWGGGHRLAVRDRRRGAGSSAARRPPLSAAREDRNCLGSESGTARASLAGCGSTLRLRRNLLPVSRIPSL
jgi:hypothetical protein